MSESPRKICPRCLTDALVPNPDGGADCAACGMWVNAGFLRLAGHDEPNTGELK
jgi:hypothetical protein